MNAKQRYRARRAAEHRERRQFAQRINRAFTKLSEGCSDKVVRATSLDSLRDKPAQEEITERKNRIWYKDANPLGNKIHAVQKMRGKSIPAYYD